MGKTTTTSLLRERCYQLMVEGDSRRYAVPTDEMIGLQRCLDRILERHLQPAVMREEGEQLPDMVLHQMEPHLNDAIRRWDAGEDVRGVTRRILRKYITLRTAEAMKRFGSPSIDRTTLR